MATVRIYKVAELLGTTSQEVTALLKRDHGIEVKSASSTIEEVVARQFVERLARQRNIQLPSGDIFAETPVVKGKKPRAVEESAGAGQAGRAGAAAAAPRQDGEAGRASAGFGRIETPSRPRAEEIEPAPVETPEPEPHRRAGTAPTADAPSEAPSRRRRAQPVESRGGAATGRRRGARAPEPPRSAQAGHAGPRGAADAASPHRRTAADSADTAAADHAAAADGAAPGPQAAGVRATGRHGHTGRRTSRRRARPGQPMAARPGGAPGAMRPPAPRRPRCRWADHVRCRRSPFARRSPDSRRARVSTRSGPACPRGRRISSVPAGRDGPLPASGAIRGRRRRRRPPRLRPYRAPSRSPRA